jgi:NitT/TauT family transport system ATP-binding protein
VRHRRAAAGLSLAFLELSGIRKSFGAGGAAETLALADVTLEVTEGEFVAVVGPSGCGKSTLLQIAAALVAPSGGEVRLNGARVTAPPESMVYLFQQYAKSLFAWRTVIDNVAFAVEHRPGMTRRAAREHSRRFLEMVGLAEFWNRYPWQLSGGMQQRVAIARALAAEPRVLLMDEPFSSVDALTRLELHGLILELWAAHRFTAVLVTHDVDEAVFLADRVTALPRPRDNLATREDPRFLALRHELLSMLLKPHG